MRILVATSLLASCGHQRDPADTGGLPGDCSSPDLRGSFAATIQEGSGGLDGDFLDNPQPLRDPVVLEEGACAYHEPEPHLCEPACTAGTVCGFGDTCRPWPGYLDVGTIHLRGSTPPLDLEPTEYGVYYTPEAYPGLFAPGDELTLEVEGGGEVEPFSLVARGVAAWGRYDEAITARSHEDLAFTWDPGPGPEEAEVVLHLDNDHHAALAAWIECRAPDADGGLVVPAALVDAMLEAGQTGIGTYIENAWAMRTAGSCTPTSRGAASFATSSTGWVSVESEP